MIATTPLTDTNQPLPPELVALLAALDDDSLRLMITVAALTAWPEGVGLN